MSSSVTVASGDLPLLSVHLYSAVKSFLTQAGWHDHKISGHLWLPTEPSVTIWHFLFTTDDVLHEKMGLYDLDLMTKQEFLVHLNTRTMNHFIEMKKGWLILYDMILATTDTIMQHHADPTIGTHASRYKHNLHQPPWLWHSNHSVTRLAEECVHLVIWQPVIHSVRWRRFLDIYSSMDLLFAGSHASRPLACSLTFTPKQHVHHCRRNRVGHPPPPQYWNSCICPTQKWYRGGKKNCATLRVAHFASKSYNLPI